MNISFSVRLPVDAQSVPLARGLLRAALEQLGVAETGIEETVLALTEACANVVQHAGEHEEYQVDVEIDDQLCRISVLDGGEGFDPTAAEAPHFSQDGGRGLFLMRALVDRLRFRTADDGRHGVILEKQLAVRPRSRLPS